MADDTMILHQHEDVETLKERMNELLMWPLLTNADRVEQYGIWQLISAGSVEYSVLCTHLNTLHGADTWLDDDELVAQANKVWRRLCHLVQSGRVEGEAEDQNDRWAREVFATFDSLLHRHRLDLRALHDKLPQTLRDEVEGVLRRRWFGSLYALGEAIELHHLQFGADAGAYIADVLARAVEDALKAYKTTQGDEQRRSAGRALFFWQLLKGFTFSMASRDIAGSSVPAGPDQTGIVDRISDSLRGGLDLLGQLDLMEDVLPAWKGATSTSAEKLTAELMAELHSKIAEVREVTRGLAEMR